MFICDKAERLAVAAKIAECRMNRWLRRRSLHIHPKSLPMNCRLRAKMLAAALLEGANLLNTFEAC
jgi:hypothetical protein